MERRLARIVVACLAGWLPDMLNSHEFRPKSFETPLLGGSCADNNVGATPAIFTRAREQAGRTGWGFQGPMFRRLGKVSLIRSL